MKKKTNKLLRVGVSIVVLAIAAAAAVTGMRRNVRNVESAGSTIVCFGDSLTYGYGADRGADYPARLAAYVRFPVINAGVDSDTSEMGLLRLENDVLSRNPFLVIVEFGANDFLKSIPLEQTKSNMRSMIRRIQDRGAMVAVMDISAGFLFREYRDLAAALAREQDCIFIPGGLRGIITNPSLKSDFVHPNAKGYSLIAQRVFLAVNPYLRGRSGPGGGTRAAAMNRVFPTKKDLP